MANVYMMSYFNLPLEFIPSMAFVSEKMNPICVTIWHPGKGGALSFVPIISWFLNRRRKLKRFLRI